MKKIIYLIMGILFGWLLTKSEALSWFRIQEMFRFQSFHMYGIIGSAVLVGMTSLLLIKKYSPKSLNGNEITIPKKSFNKGTLIGGLIFGMGWAMAGACPGPLFALIGSGYSVVIVVLLFAILGTWTYAFFRDKLPH